MGAAGVPVKQPSHARDEALSELEPGAAKLRPAPLVGVISDRYLSGHRAVDSVRRRQIRGFSMIILVPLIKVTILALNFYLWVVLAYVIMSWLVNFRVINLQNQFVRMVWEFLWRISDVTLGRIRRYVPGFGGMDISPLILILIIYFIQYVLQEVLIRLTYG